MSYHRRIIILNLALVVIGMGATVVCRAEGAATPRAASGLQSAALLLCSAVFAHCDPAALSSQKTARNVGRHSNIGVRPSLLASGARGATAGSQTSNSSVPSMNINLSEASTGADTDVNMGKLSLNLTLHSNYHGAIYNVHSPFEPMQISLSYMRAW